MPRQLKEPTLNDLRWQVAHTEFDENQPAESNIRLRHATVS